MAKAQSISAVAPDNPNVWVVPIPAGGVNVDQLSDEMSLALPGRIWSVNIAIDSNNVRTGIRVGFISPPSPAETTTADGVVAAHNPAVLTQAQQDALSEVSDESSFRDGVVQAVADGQAALVTIGDTSTPGSDLALLVNDRAAVNAATLAAPLKAALLDVIDIQTRTLSRQKRIIQILLAAVKAVRWLITS